MISSELNTFQNVAVDEHFWSVQQKEKALWETFLPGTHPKAINSDKQTPPTWVSLRGQMQNLLRYISFSKLCSTMALFNFSTKWNSNYSWKSFWNNTSFFLTSELGELAQKPSLVLQYFPQKLSQSINDSVKSYLFGCVPTRMYCLIKDLNLTFFYL